MLLKQKLVLLLLLFNVSICLGQFSDNFSDGDFTNNPSWTGETNKFIVNTNFRLQLNNAAVSDIAHLAAAAPTADSTIWEFYVRLNFSPSANNNVRIYLKSDNANLEGPLNGYFIKIGENGSLDGIDLFEQTGLSETLIVSGVDGHGAVNPELRIRVTRDSIGNWTIFSDTTGGTNYIFEGSGFSNNHKIGQYIGVYCKHTSTNATKFFFDDFYVAPLFVDTIAPTIQSIEILSANSIKIKFTEPPDPTTALLLTNYIINKGIGNPIAAFIDPADSAVVQLQFANSFQNAETYTITAINIGDKQGNINPVDTAQFSFYEPQFGDVLINELMADPTPPVGLPEEEFVEIYNNTTLDINLSGWTFSDATATVVLPNVIIPADSFAIIAATSKAALFAPYGIIIPVTSLPSLNNTGDQLTLRGPSGEIIDSINYSDKWYGDAAKAAGGWTLERKYAQSLCGSTANWSASVDPSGGTPGRTNSLAAIADTAAPQLISVVAVAPDTVHLIFNESINPISASSISNYSISSFLGNIISAITIPPDNKIVELALSQTLDSSTTYTLAANNISDCAGNIIGSQNSQSFSIPKSADRFDIVINEIMADPDPPVALPNIEYIELYNRSSKNISLKNWQLSDGNSTGTFGEFVISPGEFIIVAAAANAALLSSIGSVISPSTWPSLNNAGDSLTLKNSQGKLIHFVYYSDSWYNSTLKKSGGWSLEMIDADNPCAGNGNWSASTDPSGGTPGKENSIQNVNSDLTAPEISKVILVDSIHLRIYFTEAVPDLSVNQLYINPTIGIPDSILLNPANLYIADIFLPAPAQPKIVYNIIAISISDCAGNAGADTAQFGIPEVPEFNDLLINEILYNPATGGSDFVEIYNHSDKIIDLKNTLLARTDASGNILSFTALNQEGLLMFPGDYFAFSPDPGYIRQNYYSPSPEHIFQLKSMPSYPDNEGGVVLLKKNTEVIDKVYYYDDWEHPLIDDHNGISLERISFTAPSQDEDNWHSASTLVRATPAYKNSQSAGSAIADGQVWIDPEVFSPNNDGYNDYLEIFFSLESQGNASITIFNVKGQPVKHLLKNDLISSEGKILWNGTDDNKAKLASGIYIIYFEFFNLHGQQVKKKLKTVLSP